MIKTILLQAEDFAGWDDAQLLAYDQNLTHDMSMAAGEWDLPRLEELRLSSKALAEYLSARALCFAQVAGFGSFA